MSLPPTHQKLKKCQKTEDINDKNYDNTNLAFNLSGVQNNEEKTKEDNVQKTSKVIKAEYLNKNESEDLVNSKKYLENMFEQQTHHRKRLATASPTQHVEEFLEEKSCSISLAGQAHLQITSIDGFFNRKRGRPPKNRFVEVYKNAHQKPQAIFTSFKLEKHDTNETAANAENAATTHFLHTSPDTLMDGEIDGSTAIQYSRHEPLHINSTQRTRLYKKVNNISTCSGDDSSKTVPKRINDVNITVETGDYSFGATADKEENRLLKTCKQIENTTCKKKKLDMNCVTSFLMDAHENQACIEEESTLTNTSQISNKHKLGGTSENVTVVRAAGTFYPENSNGISKFTDNFLEKLRDTSKKKRISSTYTVCNEEIRENSNTPDIDMPQNLSIKDTPPFEMSSPTAPAATLPQILNVLQTQQNLLAFYQQMALLTPAFFQFDFKTLVTSTSSPTPLPTAGSEMNYSPFVNMSNQDLQKTLVFLNMFSNMQQINQVQKSNANKETTISERETQKEASTTEILSTPHNIISFRNDTTADSDIQQQPSSSRSMQNLNFYKGRERTPTGYLRFRFNEDCGYDKCGYRQHQSHFHCNRSDCQYSFCDKTRFVQHTARHERLDTLMGSDFQQYRATMLCHYDNCPYNNSAEEYREGGLLSGRKSSHFHCLKCQFVCADTNKVVAHRRLHSKMEFIHSAGFRKVASNENCEVNLNQSSDSNSFNKTSSEKLPTLPPSTCSTLKNPPDFSDILQTNNVSHCPYSMRHAHYHCLTCNCSVLSRSQLVAHKHRTPGTSATPSISSLSDVVLPTSVETIAYTTATDTTSRSSSIS